MAVALFVVGIIVDLAAILSGVAQADLIGSVQRGNLLPTEVASANDSRQRVLGALQMVAAVAGGVLFLRWISRAYRNLPALSARKPTFTAGWAVGSWFVPFLNLVRPFQIVRETWWVSSNPKAADLAASGFTPQAPPLLTWWWATWLIATFLSQQTFRMSMSAKSVPELLSLSYAMIAADLVSIVAAVLAIQVVRRVSLVQDVAAKAALKADST